MLLIWQNFLLTYAIELPCYALATRQPLRRVAGFVLLMNLVSWPLATVLYWRFPTHLWWIEALVVAIETALLVRYQRQRPVRALGLALLLNAASYGLGTLLLRYWPLLHSQ